MPCVSLSACPREMGTSVICPCGEICACWISSLGKWARLPEQTYLCSAGLGGSTIRKTCADSAFCL